MDFELLVVPCLPPNKGRSEGSVAVITPKLDTMTAHIKSRTRLYVGSCIAFKFGTGVAQEIAKPPLVYPKAIIAQISIFTRAMILMCDRKTISSIVWPRSVAAAITPRMIFTPLITPLHQQMPFG